jgi:assimilatory nitrate reductase catalytic subunit
LGALAKFGMGLMHGDGNTRQCMATAVSAYKEAFGFDAPPYAYADFEESDLIVLVGSNLCIAHPILWERVCRNQRQAEIVVVDPRRTETAMAATQHLAPRPKTDLALFYGLANWLCQNGAVAEGFVREHTLGFEAFRAHVAEYSLERTSDITGLPVEQIERLALSIRRAERVSFWWTMGINQSHQGVRTAQALINLALMTGNIGRPGTGANSITGQCNAMGSRLFANTTNLLGGHDFKNPSDRKKVAETLGISADRIPDNAGFAYDQIMEGIVRGKIKALWVAGTNTAHSWINQADALDALRRLEFLVVQDMYFTTETAALAHLVLPAAGWGEKEGTFINSERRLARIRKVSRPPGQALPDFYIFKLIAEAWGVGDLFRRWSHPEAVFQILKELSREQPCDISGIRDYSMLDECGGVQWPFRAGDVVSAGSERRLFCDGRFYHADGKARFCFESPRPLPEVTSQAYPLALLTGRGTSAQWHTQTRTGKVQLLNELGPQDPYVELSPIDARALGVAPDEWVLVESQRGRFCARAHVTHVVRPGEVFVPMHYPKANQLTLGAFDPYSRQPAYKFAAVRVRRLTAEERPSTGPFNRFNTTS